MLGPTLFNIFLTEFFLIIVEAEFASYADNNILYDAGNTAENVMLSLQEPFKSLFKWFPDNEMQGNSGKCHLILSLDKSAEMLVGEYLIKSANCEKLLGIKIDSKLKFHRVRPYMTIEKKIF